MRALDVPARVVTGYQGGERNTVDDYWVVRQSDAHAWAEVWLPQRGWVRVDPTSAVAPSRVGALQRLQAPRGVIASALGNVSPALALGLRAAWDAMNNGWNQWVLNYTQSKQLGLLKDIGFESPSWEDLGLVLAGVLVLVSLMGAGWTLWERSQHDPWLRLLGRTIRRLGRAGIVIAPNSPPRRIAQQLRAPPADIRAEFGAIADWLLRLEALRYANPQSSTARTSLAALRREWRQLPWPA